LNEVVVGNKVEQEVNSKCHFRWGLW